MNKLYKSPLIMLIVGIMVVCASSAGATKAAINAYSASNSIEFSTEEFEVKIIQDGEDLVDGSISFANLEDDGSIKIGKQYNTSVAIKNVSKSYDEFVRVIVRKSWKDADGSKNRTLDPALIELSVNEEWQKYEDPEFTKEDGYYKEYEVYYLPTSIAGGEVKEFLQGIKINNEVVEHFTVEGTGATVKNVYTYNGESASISIQADAVQARHAEDAIFAAWGMTAECTEDVEGNVTGPITLK